MKIAVFLLLTLTFTPSSVSQVASEDEALLSTQARSDAQRDAENYNANPWEAAGFLAPIVSVSFNVGLYLLAPDAMSSIYCSPLGCLGCLSAIPVAVLGYSNTRKVSPPTERLMGKSAEYVLMYMETYTQAVKHKRLKRATRGCVVGSLIQGVVGVAVIYHLLSEWEPAFW